MEAWKMENGSLEEGRKKPILFGGFLKPPNKMNKIISLWARRFEPDKSFLRGAERGRTGSKCLLRIFRGYGMIPSSRPTFSKISSTWFNWSWVCEAM